MYVSVHVCSGMRACVCMLVCMCDVSAGLSARMAVRRQVSRGELLFHFIHLAEAGSLVQPCDSPGQQACEIPGNVCLPYCRKSMEITLIDHCIWFFM